MKCKKNVDIVFFKTFFDLNTSEIKKRTFFYCLHINNLIVLKAEQFYTLQGCILFCLTPPILLL